MSKEYKQVKLNLELELHKKLNIAAQSNNMKLTNYIKNKIGITDKLSFKTTPVHKRLHDLERFIHRRYSEIREIHEIISKSDNPDLVKLVNKLCESMLDDIKEIADIEAELKKNR